MEEERGRTRTVEKVRREREGIEGVGVREKGGHPRGRRACAVRGWKSERAAHYARDGREEPRGAEGSVRGVGREKESPGKAGSVRYRPLVVLVHVLVAAVSVDVSPFSTRERCPSSKEPGPRSFHARYVTGEAQEGEEGEQAAERTSVGGEAAPQHPTCTRPGARSGQHRHERGYGRTFGQRFEEENQTRIKTLIEDLSSSIRRACEPEIAYHSIPANNRRDRRTFKVVSRRRTPE
ncbi:hypothetical protein KM043_010303 [Ampulex compressa]|nr:hypothetical protein KM043_010303 [Ampulex compressa]